jgi:hypothetical protein
MYVFISVKNLNFIDDDHKELSLSKEIDFKTKVETLNTWISLNTYPNDMKFFSHIQSFMRSQSYISRNAQIKEIRLKNQIYHKVFKSS